MNIDLLGNKLLIRPLKVQIESTIEIPDDAEQPGVKYAKVVHAGCGDRNSEGVPVPLFVKAGLTIMHNISEPMEVEFNGEELQLIAESSVIGVVYD